MAFDKWDCKVVTPKKLQYLRPGYILFTQFFYRLRRAQSQIVAGIIKPMKISRKIIGNRSRELPAVVQCQNNCTNVCPLLSIMCYQSFVNCGVKASLELYILFCVQHSESGKTITFNCYFELWNLSYRFKRFRRHSARNERK